MASAPVPTFTPPPTTPHRSVEYSFLMWFGIVRAYYSLLIVAVWSFMVVCHPQIGKVHFLWILLLLPSASRP
jgi:hypothetical protein